MNSCDVQPVPSPLPMTVLLPGNLGTVPATIPPAAVATPVFNTVSPPSTGILAAQLAHAAAVPASPNLPNSGPFQPGQMSGGLPTAASTFHGSHPAAMQQQRRQLQRQIAALDVQLVQCSAIVASPSGQPPPQHAFASAVPPHAFSLPAVSSTSSLALPTVRQRRSVWWPNMFPPQSYLPCDRTVDSSTHQHPNLHHTLVRGLVSVPLFHLFEETGRL